MLEHMSDERLVELEQWARNRALPPADSKMLELVTEIRRARASAVKWAETAAQSHYERDEAPKWTTLSRRGASESKTMTEERLVELEEFATRANLHGSHDHVLELVAEIRKDRVKMVRWAEMCARALRERDELQTRVTELEEMYEK